MDESTVPEATLHIRAVDGESEWQQAQAIRREVFVQEQSWPEEEEFDALDPLARQVLGTLQGRAVATARWREVTWAGLPAVKLERFAVVAAARGKGWGRALVRWVIEDAAIHGHDRFLLDAQSHLVSFYAGFGFRPVGEAFEHAGIPHRTMVLEGVLPPMEGA